MKHSVLFVLVVFCFTKAYSQSGLCDPIVPFYNVNLSGQPSGTWTSTPPIQRAGNCCGTTSPDRCIEFQITLDPTAVAINFNIASGAVPPGAMYYQIGCGTPVPVGQPICLNGPGPYTLTFCKPGNNMNTYAITSIPGPSVSPADTTSQGCAAQASVYGLITSSITWTSISPGAIGQYNSFLSCNSACPSVNVTPTGTTYPPYVDYKVCGTPAANACLGSSSFCDTVRIFFNPPITNTITPNPAVFCSSDGGITLTGTINGGVPPYVIKWKNSAGVVVGSGTTYYATAAGTYVFEVQDANYPACPSNLTNVTVTQQQLPTVNAGPDQTVCGTGTITLAGAVQNSTSYTWVGGSGNFSPSRNVLNPTYTPSSTEITNGSVTFSLTTTGASACPAVSDQVTITIKPALIANINGPSIMCYGQAYNLTTNVNGGTAPYSYLWNTGNTNSGISNITAGSYNVTVTDASPGPHCTATASINIIQNPAINVTATPDALVSCNVMVNINANANGGSGGFSYSWNNGSVSSQISVYSGTYTVTATDMQGCSAQSSVSVVAPNSTLTSSVNGQSIICPNGTSTLTATGSGGFGTYTYQWSNGGTTNSINVPAGNYCVNVTDANGCISSSCINVTQTTPVNVSISAPSLICQGATALITANSTGGTSPYSYQWSNGSLSSSINQGIGNYSVTATDALGCIGTSSITVSQAPSIVLTMSSQMPNCFGQSNGSASVLVSGGIGPYNYSWSFLGNTNPTLTSIPAGSYTVTVVDAMGCNNSGSVIVSQPPPLTVNNTNVNLTCYNVNTGSSTAFVTGGTAAYQYSWSNGQSSATATNLSAGNYTLTVIDAKGCTVQNAVTITQPSQITSVITVASPVSCNGGANGSLGVTASNGTPGYTYSWSTSPVQTSSNAINLSAGSYTVTITDNNGCVVNNSYTLSNPPVFSASIQSITNVSCFGGSNGSVTASAIGGQGPYTYSWSNSGTGTATSNGFSAGSYSVLVTDNLGCSITVPFSISEPSSALQVNAGNSLVISCAGSSPITAVASGGSPAYSYLWSTGSGNATITASSSGNYNVTVTDSKGCTANTTVTVSLINSNITVSINSAQYICAGQTALLTAITTGGNGAINYSWNNGGNTSTINVGVGNYCVTATDQDGCSASDCKNMLQAPALIVNNVYAKACPGGTATLNANVSGGNIPYSYLWNTGSSNAGITGLAGNYSYSVTDNNGCSGNANGIIIPTTNMTIGTSNLQNISCFGGNNGAISVTISGGTSPYSYNWSPVSSTSNMIYNLNAGSYSVTATDSLGCTATRNFVLTEPSQALTLTPLSQNVSCYGGSNGSASVTAGGGASPYSYLWLNGNATNQILGITAGSYTVYVTDTNGCAASHTFIISQPNLLDLNLVNSANALCNGSANGTATLTSTGGTRPVTYLWSNSLTDSTAANLTAGSYTVLITDNHNCKDSVTFVISQPSVLSYNSNITNAICTNDNGIININGISGGTAGYSILWYDGVTTFSHANLLPGFYVFTIKDSHNCILKDTLEVGVQSFALNISLTKTDVNCLGQNNGSIASSVSNGSIPFVYNWSNGSSSPGISSLFPGNYNLQVTDANGCTGSDSIAINILHYVSLTTTIPNLICYKDSVIINASGAVNYAWYNNSNALISNNPQLLVIPTTSTQVYVIGSNDVCTDTAYIDVNVLPRPTVNAGSDTSKCVGSFVQLSASGAINYSWYPSTGLNNPNTASPVCSNNTIQSYIVTGTDINGCTNTDTIVVGNYALPSIFLSIQDSICKGSTSQFNAGGGTVYSWSPGATLSATNTASVVSTALVNTNYTLQVESAQGCLSDTTFTLHIIPPPVITLTPSAASICKNDTLSITASGASTYSWLPNSNISNLTGATTNVYPPASTFYYVTGTFHTCSSLDSILINVNPLPAVNAGNNFYDMCEQGNVQINGSGSGNILWTPSQGLSNNTILNPVANPAATTTYTLTIIDGNGCKNSDTAVVRVNPIPVANFSVAPVCFGNTSSFTNLSTISSGTNSSYFWIFGNLGSTTSNLFNTTHLYDTCGNFSTTLIVTSDKGCQNVTVKTAVVSCPPLLQYNINDSTLCEADKVILQNYTVGASSYLWNFGDGNFSTNSSTTHYYNNFGSYNITLTATNSGGCSDSLTKTVTVYDKPDANFTPIDVCLDNVTNFTDISTIGDGFINGWLWNFGSLGITNVQNASITFPGAGNYNVSLIVTSNYGCTDTVFNVVRVFPKPQITITAPNACFGQPTTITASVIGSPLVSLWEWDFTQDGGIDATGATPSYTFTTIGNQIIEVIGTGTNGCKDTIQTSLQVFPLPVADFYTKSQSSCAPSCYTFYDSSSINSITGSSITQYLWQANGSTFSSVQDSAVFCSSQGGLYDIKLTLVSSDGCTASIVKNDFIEIYPLPVADFSFSPDQFDILNSLVEFNNLSTNANHYFWNFGDKDSSVSSSFEPYHQYNDTGYYCIKLNAFNDYGCEDTVTKCLTVNNGFTVYIANAFTPDHDKLNEIFKPYGYGFYPDDSYEFLIFNRWGDLIFESHEYDLGWNGIPDKGTDVCQTDVYVYKLKVKEISTDDIHKYVGKVTLLK